MTAEEIAIELSKKWIDPEWTIVAVPTAIHVCGERHEVYALPHLDGRNH